MSQNGYSKWSRSSDIHSGSNYTVNLWKVRIKFGIGLEYVIQRTAFFLSENFDSVVKEVPVLIFEFLFETVSNVNTKKNLR